MVTIVGNGHGDPSSNPGQGCLHYTDRKSANPPILPPALDK